MTKRSYWYFSPRGFANEYDIGIACTREDADWYSKHGYGLCTRAWAIHQLRKRDDAATQMFVTVSISTLRVEESRFEIAKALKNGLPLPKGVDADLAYREYVEAFVKV